MKIYKIAQQATNLTFYHATIPRFADEIVESGLIRPSQELDDHQGWGFGNYELGHKYGEVVYLADNKDLSTYYASVRLHSEWEITDTEELYDEDMRFIGMFKVYVNPQSKRLRPAKNAKGELVYFGSISNNVSDEAYWVGPEWISLEDKCDQYIAHREKVNKELE